jgi:hypothetical protein
VESDIGEHSIGDLVNGPRYPAATAATTTVNVKNVVIEFIRDAAFPSYRPVLGYQGFCSSLRSSVMVKLPISAID